MCLIGLIVRYHSVTDDSCSENLYKRARALRRKQSSGNIAPPIHSPTRSGEQQWTHHYSVHMSPNASLYEDLLPQTSLLSTRNTLCQSVRDDELKGGSHSIQDLSHTNLPYSPNTSGCSLDNSRLTSDLPRPSPRSLASKVKGIVSSYLFKPSQRPPPNALEREEGPRLPVPPPEVFLKPRPPIITPTPKPAPKPPHPKDLVQLHHVASTQTSSAYGSSQSNPVPTDSAHSFFSRERRDSGASVKDLVKTFENMEKLYATECESDKALQLRRKTSIQSGRNVRLLPKPDGIWRP